MSPSNKEKVKGYFNPYECSTMVRADTENESEPIAIAGDASPYGTQNCT